MEASALQAPAALTRSRLSIGSPLLRLRSDDQLVALFRSGNEEAFRVIYDRYRQRLFAYARQMLPGPRQDAEDALQDIFVRAYSGLRASDRQLTLRAWLYRVAHNRCIDELRRPELPSPELMQMVRPPVHDPIAEAERRESMRRLIEDVRRLPDQQRSALLMRELGGMAYNELSVALGVSVPAVKSLLVRARIGLVQAVQARDTACSEIREELIVAHDRGVRPSGMARRHMRDCTHCRAFRGQIRGTSRQIAALVPLGPLGLIANLFGFGGGAASGSAAGSGAAGSGVAAAGGVAGTSGAVATITAAAGGAATHVATIIAAAVVTAGGAVAIQHSVTAAPHHSTQYVTTGAAASPASGAAPSTSASSGNSAAIYSGAPSATTPLPAPTGSASSRRRPADPTPDPQIPAVDELNPAANTAATTPNAAATGSASATTPGTGASSTSPSTATGTTSGQPTDGTSGTTGATSTGIPTLATGTDSTGSSASSPTSTGDGASGETTTTGSTNGTDSSGAAQSSSSAGTPVAVPATDSAHVAPRAVRDVKRAVRSRRQASGHRPRVRHRR